MVTQELKGLHQLKGIKARHIPSELTDEGWWGNPEHEEEVLLLEYFYHSCGEGVCMEGILFLRADMTLGKDRLDSFTII